MAKYWLHNGHLSVVERDEAGDWQQIKMSKSLGNVVNIRDVVADMPAEALRWVYVRTHYRSPLPYSSEALHDAMGVLARLYEAKERAQEIANTAADSDPSKLAKESAKAGELYKLIAGFRDAFEDAMDQDLNTALASIPGSRSMHRRSGSGASRGSNGARSWPVPQGSRSTLRCPGFTSAKARTR